MKYLFILNDPPYGTERSYNGLRLARELLKDPKAGNEVHVFLDLDEPTGYYVEEIIEGSTIIQCLGSVQYDEYELKRRMKQQMDDAIKSDRMKPSEAMRLLDDYERGLKAYTYLSF